MPPGKQLPKQMCDCAAGKLCEKAAAAAAMAVLAKPWKGSSRQEQRSPSLRFNFQFSSLSPFGVNLTAQPPLWKAHISYSSYNLIWLHSIEEKKNLISIITWPGFKVLTSICVILAPDLLAVAEILRNIRRIGATEGDLSCAATPGWSPVVVLLGSWTHACTNNTLEPRSHWFTHSLIPVWARRRWQCHHSIPAHTLALVWCSVEMSERDFFHTSVTKPVPQQGRLYTLQRRLFF